MIRQTESATSRVRDGVSSFARDALELGELQAMLLAEDVSKAKGKIAWGIALLVVSTVLSLAVLTVLVLSLGGGLASVMEWPAWAGQLAVSGGSVVVLAIAAWLGVRLLLKSTEPLGRSASEFKSNWAALKDAVTSPSEVREPLPSEFDHLPQDGRGHPATFRR